MKKITLIHIILLCTISSFAGGNKIVAYFNHPVDTAFSIGTNAIYLNDAIGDTLVAYIDRAKYSLDIAIYELSQTGTMADVVGALNAAAARGVTVRLIYDGKDNASTSISALDAAVNRLASPSGNAYNIMHNKFMIVDAGSSAPSDAIVWTGSTNWTELMFKSDYNNTIILQDQPLAKAYVAEFNQMWGDSGTIPNTSLSKFGQFKTPTTAHTFTVDGYQVDLYFGPSDGTNSQIVSALGTADRELFFGVYTFTESSDASVISSKYTTSGMVVKGIMDQYSDGYAAYNTLHPLMGNDLKIYISGNTVYHSKMAIIDPDYPALDPQVLTGSHNWSTTADTKNDENMIIVHDSTLANIYLQSFAQNFKDLGGTIDPLGTTTAIDETQTNGFGIYPNPTSDKLCITSPDSHVLISLTDLTGRLILSQSSDNASFSLSMKNFDSGSYLIRISGATGTKVYTIVKM